MRNTDHHAAWSQETTAAAANARSRLRASILLLLAAFVILWVFAEGISIRSQLPERIPTHFGLHGEPDGWAAKSVFSVFGVLIVDAVMLAVIAFAASPRLSARHYNFPGKERILSLPLPQQGHVLAPIREGMGWLGAAVGIGLALLSRQAWAVALARQEAISPWVIVVPMATGIAAVVIGIIHARRRVADLEQTA